MHSLLSKPLDWFVLQLARRYVERTAASPAQVVSFDAPAAVGALFLEPSLPPVEVEFGGEDAFRFASPTATKADETSTVFGRFFKASPQWEKRPTAILLHGWNAELCYHRMFPYLAAQLRRERINTVTLELPYHMQRRPRQGVVRDFISSDLQTMLEATRQAIADIRAFCRWLEAHGATTIGLWGFSLGAWLAGLIARCEERLGFLVLTTPIVQIDRAVAELPFCGPVRRSLGRTGLRLEGLNLEMERPCVAAENILLVQSRHDLFAPAETMERLWEAWGRPEMWRLAHGHISVLMSVRLMGRTVRWIGRRTG